MGAKTYSDGFKRDGLSLVVEDQRSVAEIERDLRITLGLNYKWQQHYPVKEDRLQPNTKSTEQAEIKRLKRELEIMRQEHGILKNCICVA